MSARSVTRVNFGRPVRAVRMFGAAFSHRLDLKTAGICVILLLVALLVGIITLGSGDFHVPPVDVFRALLGQAEGRIHMVVVEWRLPRTALALVLGAALGMSGAIFQSLTRNPLGSPDIIGFDAGAYTGALLVITLAGGSYLVVAAGALMGGMLTALLVYLLA